MYFYEVDDKGQCLWEDLDRDRITFNSVVPSQSIIRGKGREGFQACLGKKVACKAGIPGSQ